LFNPDFQDDKCDYTKGYNNNQLESPSYKRYIEEIADKLINTCRLHKDSSILEIGCGDGYFLSRLREKLQCGNVIGYDIRYAKSYGMDKFVRRKFYTHDDVAPYDLVVFRHTFEGLLSFDVILKNVLDSMHEQSYIYIETPSLDYILRQKSVGSLCYEIARYFSVRAFDRLFLDKGLVIDHVESVFGGMYLFLLGRRTPVVAGAERTYQRLAEALGRFHKAVIWGASGRAISTLCHLGLGPERVLCAVDIDPGKQGKFLPFTSQEVLTPEDALALDPDLIIVANQNYLEEIAASVGRDMHYLLLDGRLYRSLAGTLVLVEDAAARPIAQTMHQS
jgi:SAM-dependent methyltransferase